MVAHISISPSATSTIQYVSGLSVFLEPAYVSLSEEIGPFDERIGESHLIPDEPGKIPFDLMHATSLTDRLSHDVCDSGKILKASAALHMSSFPAGHEFAGCIQPSQLSQSPKKEPRKRHTKRRSVLLIASQLNELQSEDPEKIVIVRKINRLGFASTDILKEHFGQFGAVEQVRLSNAHNKDAASTYQVRLRPSGIAFVVFESSEAAAKVLAEGETRLINGVEVWVRGFERRRFDEEICEKDIEETSSIATASTRCSIDSCIDRGDS